MSPLLTRLSTTLVVTIAATAVVVVLGHGANDNGAIPTTTSPTTTSVDTTAVPPSSVAVSTAGQTPTSAPPVDTWNGQPPGPSTPTASYSAGVGQSIVQNCVDQLKSDPTLLRLKLWLDSDTSSGTALDVTGRPFWLFGCSSHDDQGDLTPSWLCSREPQPLYRDVARTEENDDDHLGEDGEPGETQSVEHDLLSGTSEGFDRKTSTLWFAMAGSQSQGKNAASLRRVTIDADSLEVCGIDGALAQFRVRDHE